MSRCPSHTHGPLTTQRCTQVVAAFDNSYDPSTAPKLDMRTLMQGNGSKPINTTQAAVRGTLERSLTATGQLTQGKTSQ